MTDNQPGDLATRLLAAIGKTERIAHAAAESVRELDSFGTSDGILQAPAATLYRCTVDRKIVAEHQQAEAGHVGDKPTGCVTCHNDPDCGITAGWGYCTTMVLLAGSYGIT